MSKIVVLSDTHWSRPECYAPELGAICSGADLIIHSGDAVEAFVLEWLQQLAPVEAVVGNCDRISVRVQWPDIREFEFAGVRFGVLHGHQVNLHRPESIVYPFSPEVQFIIHGHSHLAAHYFHESVQIFNPGSLSEPRDWRGPTYGLLLVEGGRVQASHCDFVKS